MAAKTFKIPRDILAQITSGNPQAIKAFENIEVVANSTPQDFADIVIQVEGAASQAEQAVIIATQLTAIAQQLIADIRPTLNAVSVPSEPQDYLQAVNVSNDCYQAIIPIQVTI